MRRAAFRGRWHRASPGAPLAASRLSSKAARGAAGVRLLAAAMSNKQRPISGLAEGRRLPTFEVRQLNFARGWYVRVLWRYGQEQHVSGFASAGEAQSW